MSVSTSLYTFLRISGNKKIIFWYLLIQKKSQVTLHDLQEYLSFLDGYAHKIISLKESTLYQPSNFLPFMSAITFIKEFVMYCDLLLFVQCLNAI